MTSEEIVKKEIDLILVDIIKVYKNSGRKVTGDFEKGLEVVYEKTDTEVTGTIKGFIYLAGRGRTKKAGGKGSKSLTDIIRQWLWNKGIAQKALSEAKNKTAKGKRNLIKGIAYVIAKKIHEEGTDKSRWLKVYEEVITPERILKIIDKISIIEANSFVTKFRAELEILAKDV